MEKTAELQQRSTRTLMLDKIVPTKKENEKRENEFLVSPEKQIADYITKKLAEKGITSQKYLGLDTAITAVSRELAKLSEHPPSKKLTAVIAAFHDMAKATCGSIWSALGTLSNPTIAKLFVSNPQAFSEIAKATGESAWWAFRALLDHGISALFASNPQAFVDIAKAAGKSACPAFESLSNPDIAKLFISNPKKLINAFSGLAKATGEHAVYAFGSISNPDIAKLFISDSQKAIAAFSEIIKATGKYAPWAFNSLSSPDIPMLFVNYCQNKIKLKVLLINIKTKDIYAIETGRPLDSLHDDNPELVRRYGTTRAGYLARLGKDDVLALLSSDPSFFYTSSNHKLFDRLLSDFKGQSIVEVMKEYGLWGTPSGRNFIFRAMNYGRLYGSRNSMFSEKDMPAVMVELTKPLSQYGFDPNYFYNLANTIEHMDVSKKSYVRGKLEAAKAQILQEYFLLARLPPQWAENKFKAIAFLEDMLVNSRKKPAGAFDASRYSDGKKLLFVQIFDKEDTEKTSWISSQNWWGKYLKVQPTKGASGELIYETKDVRMVLYMGDAAENNQHFISSMLTEKKNMIITFRGHSFSLSENFPNDIFKPFPGANILFMPGSCGSAGSIPGYLSSNQNIDIIGNTSTGDGFVTNTVMELLIEEARKGGKRGYKEILFSGAKRIEKAGGDASTLAVSTWGDFLLKSVYGTGQH